MKNILKPAQRHIEKLSHFNCGFCGKWWTIGDAPTLKNEWFCPWCGRENNFEQIKNPDERSYN